jgi:GTP 3',8-cyclase
MNAERKTSLFAGKLNLRDNIPLRTPYVIYVEPSGFCNFKCHFCPQYNSPGMKKSMMTQRTFDTLIHQLKGFEDKIRMIRFCGQGEPSLNKLLPTFFQQIRDNDIAEKIELVTNASYLSDVLVDSIAKHVTRTIVSVE